MAHRSKQRLSDEFVKKLKAGSQDVKAWDADVAGFGVRITPKNFRSWILQFDRGGQKVCHTLGKVKDMECAEARDKAYILRKLHEGGIDILAHQKEKISAPTIAMAIDKWEEAYAKLLKPSTVLSYRSIFRTCIRKEIGKRLLKDFNLDDVRKFHLSLVKTPIQANRAVVVLSRLFTISQKEGWLTTKNPCRDFELAPEKGKDRILSTLELARLETALKKLVETRKLDPCIADLVRFLAFSGLRRGEALGLTWAAINIDENYMKFSEHKTDKGGTIPKLLPLNKHLLKILARRHEMSDSAYVFPSSITKGQIKGLGKCWERICKSAALISAPPGLPTPTPHDLRRTFRSCCAELGFADSAGETLLGHGLGKVKDTYLKFRPEGILAKASQATADWIAEAMAGNAPKIGVQIKIKIERKPQLPPLGKGTKGHR